jgi:hypothetical protein
MLDQDLQGLCTSKHCRGFVQKKFWKVLLQSMTPLLASHTSTQINSYAYTLNNVRVYIGIISTFDGVESRKFKVKREHTKITSLT